MANLLALQDLLELALNPLDRDVGHGAAVCWVGPPSSPAPRSYPSQPLSVSHFSLPPFLSHFFFF